MKISIGTMVILCTFCLAKQSFSLNFIDVPSTNETSLRRAGDDADYSEEPKSYPPIKNSREEKFNFFRRNILDKTIKYQREGPPDDKDTDIKVKISTLVEQTLHDTDRRIKSIEHIKKRHREDAPYKAGFILSMIKKARDVLNELFNVAVHHKDEWKALEQLKIFELIVHTNVDTTNLVRQLVETHIQYLNSTSSASQPIEGGGVDAAGRKRVVLLK